MLALLGGLLIAILIYAPFLWVRYVMWKHSKDIANMPGNGRELAEHLIERFELADVKVVEGRAGEDFYSPEERIVSLSPKNYHGRSLTAVAVATHEVGHAMQFIREEPVSRLRSRYMKKAVIIKRIGAGILMIAPVFLALFKAPQALLLVAAIGLSTMLISVLMYAAILPEEYDASFNKALPILASGYVPEAHMPAVRQVLKAAAYTYVAGALTDVLNLWRWLRILR